MTRRDRTEPRPGGKGWGTSPGGVRIGKWPNSPPPIGSSSRSCSARSR
ncbi:hypothetical protein D187_000188 [Cystobacter fuscus DSM 2262]|uniref:Uncharacterized protein n=1 Tax=Cystobacter fuscus (strain ATCC 25194 / DSM 2262 / NBRC 100088 / M29) TaxID=1242864 RepID=S9PP08_CYSF2|nr:hypothetical protein D187_000188 [Cystobacter fuscus DSM 2262]